MEINLIQISGMHNTTGKDCSFCKEGFYGNPLKGTPDDCKLCNCPPESKCQYIF